MATTTPERRAYPGLKLGPFTLHAPIAAGGMGELWRGVHEDLRVPVAIKVLTEHKARSPAFYDRFWHEVQTAARLSHPHIIAVYDYGALTDEAEARSRGRLVAGSPFQVMEYADGGTLRDAPAQSWPQILDILQELLGALAHAHARGVIHRDLKPANVLLCGIDKPSPSWKLSDFGIAHALDRSGQPTDTRAERRAQAGTLPYMAPEQFRGQWRDYGPWTDLYALGCLAWALVTGRPPFVSGSFYKAARLHLTEPLPPLVPTTPIPLALTGWLQRLLAKDHDRRFKFAADAAWALEDLALEQPSPPEAFFSGTSPTPHRVKHTTEIVSVQWIQEDEGDHEAPQRDDAASQTPPMAAWRAPLKAPPGLPGVGLSLYGLRARPLVGRQSHREALWQHLVSVRSLGVPRTVVLQGPAGMGKSRLARWLCTRATETGAAHVLKAFFERGDSPGRGLARMLSGHLGCLGLDHGARLARLKTHLSRLGQLDLQEWAALAALLQQAGDLEGRDKSPNAPLPVQLRVPKERHILLQRQLALIASDRPLVIWLDDVHWSPDALAFSNFMLHQAQAPILFVLTSSDESLAEQGPKVSEALGALLSHEAASSLRVGVLDEHEVSALVQRLLGLSGEAAREVESRIGGNPLFAVHLVGDWVQRGVLQSHPEGFALDPNETLLIPDTLHDIWRGRIDGVLQGFPGEAQQALELSAALGRIVLPDELATACGIQGLSLPTGLVERLHHSRLATATEGGWSLAHGLLRESLERSARESGRWADLHRACVSMLDKRYDTRAPGIARRRAHHLTQANEATEALVWLLKAAKAYLALSEFSEVHRLLDERDKLMSALALDEGDPRWAATEALRADAHRVQWSLDEAETHAKALLTRATRHNLDHGRGKALAILAHINRVRGDLQRANTQANEALALFEALGDDASIATTALNLAIIVRSGGDAHGAIERYLRAQQIFETLGDKASAAQCLMGLGHVHRQLQDIAAARAHYEAAHAILAMVGNRHALAECLNGLADMDRYQGDLDAAQQGYRHALSLMRHVGSQNAAIVQLNLGIVLVLMGRHGAARAEFEQVIDTEPRPLFVGLGHIMLLPCLAALEDLTPWRHHLDTGTALLSASSLVDPDIASFAQLAGDTLTALGDAPRAREAYTIALAQWQGLGDQPRADTTATLIAALDAELNGSHSDPPTT